MNKNTRTPSTSRYPKGRKRTRVSKVKISRFGRVKKDWRLFAAVISAIAIVGMGAYILRSSATPFPELAYSVRCNATHFLADDPIVYPNQPGVSHMHMFFSNPSTKASSTTSTLQATPGTCGRNMGPVDRSSYWIPALYKRNADGTSTLHSSRNTFISAYYRRPGGNTGPQIQPFPNGLRMIAGNPNATTPQSQNYISWQCGAGGPIYSRLPACTGSYANQPIRGDILFPSCWDGKNLDSVDHKSHMSYPANMDSGACPSTHPVSLPQLNFEIWFDGLFNGTDYYLSSDKGPSGYSLHGDFWNAWTNQEQNALVTACLNQDRACIGIERSTDGRTLFIAPGSPYPQHTITVANFPNTNPWDGRTVTPTFPPATPPPATPATPKPTTSAKPTPTPTTPTVSQPTHSSGHSPSPTPSNPGSSPTNTPEYPSTPTTPTPVYEKPIAKAADVIASTSSRITNPFLLLIVLTLLFGLTGWLIYKLVVRLRG